MKIIQIAYSNFTKRVMKELAFVGKRQQATKGDPLFSVTTFSSAEESVVKSAVVSATNIIVKELKEFVVNYFTTKDDDSPDKITGVEFAVENTRNDENIEEALEQAVCSFLTSYATATVLSRIAPDLAKVYSDEATMFLQSAVALAVNKHPVANQLYTTTDMTGSITFEDDETISET